MISVCTPYWNQRLALLGMLDQYDELYGDMDLEVVIADDGSTDVPLVPESTVHPVRVVRLPGKAGPLNPCAPINRAVEASSGDIIALTKPKVRHEGPVLREMLNLLDTEDDYVTARCYGVGYGKDRLPLAGPDVDYTTNGRLPVPDGAHFHFLALFHRSLWERAGGFDEDYRHVQACDDNDWLWRLQRAGATFKCAEGTVWQPKSTTDWDLPHGRDLFFEKWPEAKR